MIMAAFGNTFGLADFDPVGGPVAGAFESALFDKGFQQIKRVMINADPVIGDGSDIKG
jgi:hypothetical protein